MNDKSTTDLKYHIFKDYNVTFDERSNSFGTLRLVQWVKGNNEPDELKAKVEIRKVTVNADGETPLKGYSFSTEEGPHELVEGMVKCGFGDTKKVLKNLATREGFKDTVKNINKDEDDDASRIVFDMRDYLVNINTNEDED